MNSFPVKIVSTRQETPTVKTIGMSLIEEQPYTFVPGAFTMVSVPESGIPARPFSFSSAPSDSNLEITVEKTGKITTALHNAKVGDTLHLSAPMGKFRLPEKIDRPLFFLVGGTGIAPVRSMLRSLAAQDVGPITLCYSAREEEDVIFQDELLTWKQDQSNIRVAVTLTRASQSARNWELGRFTKERLLALVPDLTESECFLCGSPEFVQSFIRLLVEIGLNREVIKTEQWLQPSLE
ncbi:MAG: hypothetical protein H6760_03075 [Candidatus Nomurabacteria bacterium]|nr:MAG: hypothetical protein H6760_03075 [Candidatus Nomurabacteria bacterium]